MTASAATTPVARTSKFAAPTATTKTVAKAVKAEKADKPAKAVKPAKAAKADSAPRVSTYAGKKIKVLNKEHGLRGNRGAAMDIILKFKTTDEVLKEFAKHEGLKAEKIAFAVAQGFIELV